MMLGLNAGAALALIPASPCLSASENGVGVNNAMAFGHSESGCNAYFPGLRPGSLAPNQQD